MHEVGGFYWSSLSPTWLDYIYEIDEDGVIRNHAAHLSIEHIMFDANDFRVGGPYKPYKRVPHLRALLLLGTGRYDHVIRGE